MVFKLRKMMLKVAGTPKGIMRTLKLWCLGTPATALTSFLQKMNQIAMEASVELWMGLTDSDHIQWLEYSGPAGRKLLEEVKSEADKVWVSVHLILHLPCHVILTLHLPCHVT